MLGRAVRIVRHPLRGLAFALAAFCLCWGVAMTEGIVATILGVLVGLTASEVLSKSRVRTSFALTISGVVAFVSVGLAHAMTSTELVASMLSSEAALRLAAVVRYGGLAVGATTALRLVALRRPAFLALELAAVVAGVASMFAAHRDGVIARPLWLSDWAWQRGVDPTTILLAVGGAAVVILAVLLVAESKSDLSIASLIALVALAILAVSCLDVVGLPAPKPENDLGLTPNDHGEPPREPPETDGGRPRHPGDYGDGGGRGGGDGDGGRRHGGGGGASDGGAEGGTAQTDQDGGGRGNGQRPQQQQQHADDDQDVSRRSPAPMAVVIFDDDYSPPSQMYYFRQDSWSQFKGPRLVQTTRADIDRDIVRDYPTSTVRVQDAPSARGRARVSGRIALLVQHNGPFGLESPEKFAPAANPNPQRFVRAYRFTSLAQTIEYQRLLGRKAGDPRWTPEVRAYYTQPSSDARFAELAQRIVATVPLRYRNDPFAQALAIKLWLDDNLIYSTRHRHNGVPDPTADFLFGNRTGYCVHFAHAAVFLWRSLGIPARIGTGYAADEAARQGGSALLVRGSDAHAWPELYVENLGWIVLDISAKRNIDPPGTPPDDDLQRLLGEMAREQPADPAQPQMKPKPAKQWGRTFGIGGLALLGLALVLLYAVKAWRRIAWLLAGPRALPKVAFRAALDKLGEAGIHREDGESREAFAARMRERVPALETLTAMHVAATLRRADVSPESRPERSRAEWSKTLRALRRELRRSTRLWRRLLGLVHPTSFFDTH